MKIRFYLSLVVGLAGCMAVGPDYVRRDPPVPSKWNAPTAGELRQDELAQWWRRFDDPILNQLIAEAFEQSLDTRSARLKLEEVRARADLADANVYPSLRGSLGATRSKASAKAGNGAVSNLFNAGFDAAWEVDVFGGLRRAREAAQADMGGAKADLHHVRVSLAAEVALNYWQVRAYQIRQAIAQKNLATQQETLEIAQWRQMAGLATALDVEQARSNWQQTQAALPALHTSIAKAEHRLSILTGQAPTALAANWPKLAALPLLPEGVAAGVPLDAMRQRPDIEAAERRVAAETARIGQEKAAGYPALTLNGTLGWKAATVGTLGAAGTSAGSLAASIAQTLFDAGRVRSRVRAQSAVQAQAQANYEKTVLAALEEVENALVSYADSRERQDHLHIAADAAQQAAQLARQRYESGLIDFQSVLDTERTRLSTEDGLANAQLDGLTALVGLYKALGGGWQELETTAPSSKKDREHE